MKKPIRRTRTTGPARRGKRPRHALATLTVLLVVAAFVGQASAADEQVTEPMPVDSLLARADRALEDGDAGPLCAVGRLEAELGLQR